MESLSSFLSSLSRLSLESVSRAPLSLLSMAAARFSVETETNHVSVDEWLPVGTHGFTRYPPSQPAKARELAARLNITCPAFRAVFYKANTSFDAHGMLHVDGVAAFS